MLLPSLAIIIGLIALMWSADRFVEGASATAKHLGMSPFLIGMLIMGFGTSAPEMIVSAMAALSGNPELALGNAYGSDIANIALVLGVTAIINPIAVDKNILRKDLPILTIVTFIAGYQLYDGYISQLDALILMGIFILFIVWTIVKAKNKGKDSIDEDVIHQLDEIHLSLIAGLIWVIIGLILLVVSSKILVWGAVSVAKYFGLSDLVIGLTIVSVGTSLPELAASIAAVRKNEHDMAFGNIIGSNMFNTLTVVAIAGIIKPMNVSPEILTRDWMLLITLTLSLFVMGYGFKKPGSINRIEGTILLSVFIGYMFVIFLGYA